MTRRVIMRWFVNRSSGAYEMYSFSPLVILTSGSLPRRPMRMSLDRSEERAAVDEKAYKVHVRGGKVMWCKKNAREQGRRVAGGGGRTWSPSSGCVSRGCDGVGARCLPLATCLNKPLQYPVNHHSQDYRKTLYFRHV
jgi:hypothetical protein